MSRMVTAMSAVIIMPVTAMSVIMAAMTVVTVMSVTMVVVAVAMIVFSRLVRKYCQPPKSSGQLSRSAQHGNAGQHGHINEFPSEIADGKPQQVVLSSFRRCHGAPDEDRDQHQQQNSKKPTATQNRKGLRPVDRQPPESHPTQQGDPWDQDTHQAKNQRQEGREDVYETAEQIEQSFHRSTMPGRNTTIQQ